MPGKVVRVLVTAGQSVQAGEGMVVVEAMKMENELRAPRAGVVKQIMARPGQSVESGAVLAVVS
jgi:biotin carboxyl carrier protein